MKVSPGRQRFDFNLVVEPGFRGSRPQASVKSGFRITCTIPLILQVENADRLVRKWRRWLIGTVIWRPRRRGTLTKPLQSAVQQPVAFIRAPQLHGRVQELSQSSSRFSAIRFSCCEAVVGATRTGSKHVSGACLPDLLGST